MYLVQRRICEASAMSKLLKIVLYALHQTGFFGVTKIQSLESAAGFKTQGWTNVVGQVWRPSAGRMPSCSGRSIYSLQAFHWCMRSTHTVEGYLLYPKPSNSNLNLMLKHPPRSIQNNVRSHIWICGPAKLIQKCAITGPVCCQFHRWH